MHSTFGAHKIFLKQNLTVATTATTTVARTATTAAASAVTEAATTCPFAQSISSAAIKIVHRQKGFFSRHEWLTVKVGLSLSNLRKNEKLAVNFIFNIFRTDFLTKNMQT
jgi:hypothetical protein